MSESIAVKYLNQYQAPLFSVLRLDLCFEIFEHKVVVSAESVYHCPIANTTLILAGSGKLLTLLLNQQPWSDYSLINSELSLFNLPEHFTLTIITELDPFNNKSCMGLYASQGNLFTQCEPEGFRQITYFPDRPDVLTVFTTTIIADADKYPILLSNGNLLHRETSADYKTKVVWHDPFKKPSYLFALVAGNFAVLSDTFCTSSGREVLLEVYSDAETIEQCHHCLASLKRAMAWDEQRFNLAYDLDRYMIVASNDFNMGAMENKSLNIFNAKYVIAHTQTATDSDFIAVEAVVGHEYFHNWTGNRVTCRDWFQLSLKEGLTVFRDQEFTADLHSRIVKRIEDVKALRQHQFPEDASPLAHAVRPKAYIEINNFYTMTVYEKGAEIVRMYQTILGRQGFYQGLQLYLQRHDGSAATCEDFCRAMQDANNIDLSQFMLWYSQAGTPRLKITDAYDQQQQLYTLNIEQINPEMPNQSEKQPLLIPLSIGFLNAAGQELTPQVSSGRCLSIDNNLILLIDAQYTRFQLHLTSLPTPSLGRGFSAPIIIEYPYSLLQLENLAANDSDSFNQWDVIQTLYRHSIQQIYSNNGLTTTDLTYSSLSSVFSKILSANNRDPSLMSLAVTLPSFAELSIEYQHLEVARLQQAMTSLKQQLANQFEEVWLQLYLKHQTSPYHLEDANQRALKNVALNYLMAGKNYQRYLALLSQQYYQADNMTDKFAALSAVNNCHGEIRQNLLNEFALEFKANSLVMNKWFMLQSQSLLPNTLEVVQQLLTHPQFDPQNPNQLYALIRTFTQNPLSFNSPLGYQFIADEILRIDQFNSAVAARVAQGFSSICGLSKQYHSWAIPHLQRILATLQLSADVYELISKTLAQLTHNAHLT